MCIRDRPTPGPVIDQVLNIMGRVIDNDQLASYEWYRGDKLEGSLNPDASGNFTIGGLELKEGKNPFKITAKDASGNEASEAFMVNWSARTVLTVLDGKTTVEGKVISFPVMLKSEGKVGGITFKLVYNPTFMGDPVFEWASLFGLSINSVNADTTGEVVATFLALLELVRLKQLRTTQAAAFDEIEIAVAPVEMQQPGPGQPEPVTT